MEEADTQREEPVEEAVEEEALEGAVPPAPKLRGRPVGSKNKVKVDVVPLEPPPEPEPQPVITREPTAKRAPRKTNTSPPEPTPVPVDTSFSS